MLINNAPSFHAINDVIQDYFLTDMCFWLIKIY